MKIGKIKEKERIKRTHTGDEAVKTKSKHMVHVFPYSLLAFPD